MAGDGRVFLQTGRHAMHARCGLISFIIPFKTVVMLHVMCLTVGPISMDIVRLKCLVDYSRGFLTTVCRVHTSLAKSSERNQTREHLVRHFPVLRFSIIIPLNPKHD